ncbi:hypothetical protein CS022_00540 [Veronia nyctiphanis]|uniref:DUF924 domain-containing protein n=1 Tax=Veronia nyctiphanis TaxID=1278244 RepID=A0A4Q0YU11_9GAMM|nr:DUF924 family protein [Veronia nyctiphanis]RXJ74756.1 hypothetical protein CS022_00540 [Veronia nyctiphanis]
MDKTEVLNFWFGELDGDVTKESRQKLWFTGGQDVDQEITERFQDIVSQAGQGRLTDWMETPDGTLALIILLDQFTRNIYRGLGAAFRHDEYALAVCKKGLAKGFDAELPAIQRVFFYLPLEHSELLEDQEESLFRFSQLIKAVDEQHKLMFENFYHFAEEHHDIVARFGRFPHRNSTLGRLSSEKEIQYLSGGGARFGQ